MRCAHNNAMEPTANSVAFFRRSLFAAAHFNRWRASRFRLLNPSNNSPACFTGRVPVASGVGGGLGASSANECRGPSGIGSSSEASPQVGVCKNRSFQSDAVPSTRQWSRPLYIGRFLCDVVSRRLTLVVGRSNRRTAMNHKSTACSMRCHRSIPCSATKPIQTPARKSVVSSMSHCHSIREA